MTKLNKYKHKIGGLYQVNWLDALGQSQMDKEQYEGISPKDLLVPTETFGRLYKEDELAVMILQEDSEAGIDFAIIPKGMITSMELIK